MTAYVPRWVGQLDGSPLAGSPLAGLLLAPPAQGTGTGTRYAEALSALEDAKVVAGECVPLAALRSLSALERLRRVVLREAGLVVAGTASIASAVLRRWVASQAELLAAVWAATADVLAPRHHFQVLRVRTSSVATEVVDGGPGWDFPIIHVNRDSMGPLSLVKPDNCHAVAPTVVSAEPRPTGVGTTGTIDSAEVSVQVRLVHTDIVTAQ